jgi:hypothetical protein
MESLGRESQPRAFNPIVAAKALAWFGALVLVVGTAGVLYLVTRSSTTAGSGFTSVTIGFSSTEARVSTALTLEPAVLVATALFWGVAALVWSRGSAVQ